jgi:hypothetical protein
VAELASDPDRTNVDAVVVTGRPGDLAVLRGEADVARLRDVLRQARDMIRYVTNARDAALLVRRSNAAEKLVDEALRSCQLLEEEQFELKQDAAETHLRTQRRAGELLATVLKHRGGRPTKTGAGPGTVSSQKATLRELGIERHESSRWQRFAALPQDTFDGYIDECRASRVELTIAGMAQVARRFLEGGTESDGDGKLSDGPAQLVEYAKAKRSVGELMWLDPAALAGVLRADQRREELEFVARLRVWLDEFAQALRRRASAPGRTEPR